MTLARFCLAALLLLPLSGCGDDEPPPVTNFAQLEYGYLTKLRLNVGSVDVINQAAPLSDADIAAQSPTPPAQALAQMAHDRLFPAGLTGRATFVIDQASIVREPNGTLDGQLGVHLEITTAGGTRAGYAEARVSRQHTPGSEEEDLRSVLYDMTKQMMADMNVELEYQIKRSLSDWLVTGSAVPAAVTASPLQPAQPLPPPAPGGPIPGVTTAPPPVPSGELPSPGDAQPPPPQLSPPPGYLQLPPGTPP
jgi:hypothetical protein